MALFCRNAGEINICTATKRSFLRTVTSRQRASVATERPNRRGRISSPRTTVTLVSATLLRETRHTKIGWMDLERSVLSTIPLAVAHGASGEVASVIDGRSFLPADGRGVRLAAIEPRDEGVGSPLAAKAAPQVLPTPARHELAATGHRIYLRNAERDARNAGFALWGAPCHVVNQPGGWTDVPAEQERFAMVRGEVSP